MKSCIKVRHGIFTIQEQSLTKAKRVRKERKASKLEVLAFINCLNTFVPRDDRTLSKCRTGLIYSETIVLQARLVFYEVRVYCTVHRRLLKLERIFSGSACLISVYQPMSEEKRKRLLPFRGRNKTETSKTENS